MYDLGLGLISPNDFFHETCYYFSYLGAVFYN